MNENNPRILCWFSCGATSAIAARLAYQKYHKTHDVRICYCETSSEHPDNMRFLKDVESWIGHPVEILKSDKYDDIWDVFKKTRYLVGVKGARCTAELKKSLRFKYQQPDDIHIFGFDTGEGDRIDGFLRRNHDIKVELPLIDRALSKPDCKALLERAGIELPAMYKLGYKNANCVGCVKGQAGYWNKIRIDFPDVFDRMAKVERELDVAICKSYAGDKKRKRVFLDELPPEMGRYKEELDWECGIGCSFIEEEVLNS